MAFLINSNVIINDSRELIGVNTAGINTALYVGEIFEVDSVTGVATVGGIAVNSSSTYTGVTADLNVSAASTELAQADAIKTYVDSQVGANNQLLFTGDTGNQGDIDLAQLEVLDIIGTTNQIESDVAVALGNTITFALSSTLDLPGTLQIGTGQTISSIGVATDLGGATPVNTILPTQQAVKEYVDGRVAIVTTGGSADLLVRNIDASGIITATSALEVEGNATIDGTLQLDAAAGTIALNIGAGAAELADVNVGLALTVVGATRLDSTLQFGAAGQQVNSVGVATDLGGVAPLDTVLPTQRAVKLYVDQQIVDTGGALSFTGDAGSGTVDLSSQTFSIIGTSLEVETSASGQELTIGLPDSVTIANELTVTGNLNANGDVVGDTATNVSGINSVTATEYYGDGSNLTNISATNITVSEETTGSTARPIAFLDGSVGSSIQVLTDVSELSFVPDTGTLSATDFNTLSDIRFKENVETIEGALDKVDALRGVTYNWKSNGHASVGVIAQEVQAVLPQLVTEGEEKITVNYNGLVGLLLQAVKELSARVDELESK